MQINSNFQNPYFGCSTCKEGRDITAWLKTDAADTRAYLNHRAPKNGKFGDLDPRTKKPKFFSHETLMGPVIKLFNEDPKKLEAKIETYAKTKGMK